MDTPRERGSWKLGMSSWCCCRCGRNVGFFESSKHPDGGYTVGCEHIGVEDVKFMATGKGGFTKYGRFIKEFAWQNICTVEKNIRKHFKNQETGKQ